MSDEGFLPGLLVGVAISALVGAFVVGPIKEHFNKQMLVRHNLMTVTNDAGGNRVYFYTTNWIPEKP